MTTLTINEKINTSGEPVKYGETIKIDTSKLIGVKTNKMYIRKGFLNSTLFLTNRGFGDVCCIESSAKIDTKKSLFDIIKKYAEKSNAIIN